MILLLIILLILILINNGLADGVQTFINFKGGMFYYFY